MENISKRDRKELIALIKKGNLARCEEWLRELRQILDKPYNDDENSFDRCMEITKASRDFYKEAMGNENYYRNTMLTIGVANHLRDGYISRDDLSSLSEDLRNRLLYVIDR